ncbi:KTSC domain-containing protein [Lysobacter sp. 1R34A]|uniref:KTSC domain-containing protein n=1 Tax=Lysobacter sp. 1R34A TaxID=3445786 RepID=UPI003EE826D4
MEMIRVSSSAIEAIGYDLATGLLRIRFVEGQDYDFHGVPESVSLGLIAATSKGGYYHAHIRDRYAS